MIGAIHDICFVAPNAYAALAGRHDLQHIGGSEVQQTLIARELCRRGMRVCFVTHDYGQPDGCDINGIRVYKMCTRSAGWPIARFFHPRWTSLCGALRRANASIYYQRTAGVETGQVALWCRRNGRRMIAALASDRDCTPALLQRLNWRERTVYLAGLRRADLIIAQTQRQRDGLARHFQLEATVIRSCSSDVESATGGNPASRSNRLLWVGRFSKPKRLDRLLSLARQYPSVEIDVIGGDTKAATKWLPSRYDSLPANLRFHGHLPPAEISAYYRSAAALLCTSEFEGFPNTFLEAWAHGLPVFSIIDPDNVIATHELGEAAASPDALPSILLRFLDDPEKRTRYSANCRRYFLEHHTIRAAGDAYMRALDLLRASPAGLQLEPQP